MQDPGTIYDDSGVETFDLPGEPDLILGRCFIEVCNSMLLFGYMEISCSYW